jgi:hypothetical protein
VCFLSALRNRRDQGREIMIVMMQKQVRAHQEAVVAINK